MSPTTPNIYDYVPGFDELPGPEKMQALANFQRLIVGATPVVSTPEGRHVLADGQPLVKETGELTLPERYTRLATQNGLR